MKTPWATAHVVIHDTSRGYTKRIAPMQKQTNDTVCSSFITNHIVRFAYAAMPSQTKPRLKCDKFHAVPKEVQQKLRSVSGMNCQRWCLCDSFTS